MKNILLTLLLVFSSLSNAVPLPSPTIPTAWFAQEPSDRFMPMTQLIDRPQSDFFEKAVPYLKARGVSDEADMANFIRQDLLHIEQALSVLFEQDSKVVLQAFLGDRFFLIENTRFEIDHVGRELYGPLSFYLPLIEESAPRLGLTCIRQHVFPSTQVVKVLREQDPNLSGVSIARVYFQNNGDGKIKCLELFQAGSSDEQSPQSIQATQERLSLLSADKSDASFSPIDHLSIEFATIEEIERIHGSIQEFASETLMPYQKEISHNPGDRSTNTKVLIRDSAKAPFNKIIEFVHYEKN